MKTHQFAVVEIALAGARIDRGVISAGYNHVMPSQPIAKKLLNTKRKTAATIPFVVPPDALVPARTAIDAAWPAAPNSIKDLRPKRSIVKTATQEAIKYSVPFRAASRRLRKPERPMRCLKIVAA